MIALVEGACVRRTEAIAAHDRGAIVARARR